MTGQLTDEQIVGLIASTSWLVLFLIISWAGFFMLGMWIGAHIAA